MALIGNLPRTICSTPQSREKSGPQPRSIEGQRLLVIVEDLRGDWIRRAVVRRDFHEQQFQTQHEEAALQSPPWSRKKTVRARLRKIGRIAPTPYDEFGDETQAGKGALDAGS